MPVKPRTTTSSDFLSDSVVPAVRQPAEGDVPHDVDDSQDGHEEGGVLVTDAGAQSIGHEVDEGEAAAAGQEQEGHGQEQEVRQQQEAVLLTGQEAGAEAPPLLHLRGGVFRQQGKSIFRFFGEFFNEFIVVR